MENEVKEKLEVSKIDARKTPKGRKGPVSMTIEQIPAFAHKFLKAYSRQISVERGKDYTIKNTYRDYLLVKIKEDMAKVNVKTL
jgi:hypothetical protein